MATQIEISSDPARECAAMLLGPALAGGHIVLSGGSTPRRAYQELVSAAKGIGGVIAAATFWFGDERCVEADDERSNYRMAREALFEPLGGPDNLRIRRMRGELGPDDGARDYAAQLARAAEDADGPLRFDALLVGVGPDGHTLSLFPGRPEVQATGQLVVGVAEAGLEPFVPRISFTMDAVRQADLVVLLAEGAAKADALGRAFGPGAQPDPATPVSLLAAHATELVVLADPDAAAHLTPTEGPA